jgi:type IV secretory pathway VirJ component
MSPDQANEAESRLSQINTDLAALRREEREGIEVARTFNAQARMANDRTRLAQARIRVLEEEGNGLSQALKSHENQERARLQAEAAQQRAAEEAAQAAEQAESGRGE